MSQEVFAATLATMALVAFAAVYAYIMINAHDLPRVRAVLSFGLTLLPWDRVRLPRRGAHAQPVWGSFRDWLDSAPDAPPARAVGTAPVRLHVATGDPNDPANDDVTTAEWVDAARDRLLEALAAPTAVVPTLDIRAAEIRAHDENELHSGPVPERTDEGATADWSPVAEVAQIQQPVAISRTEPDMEELAILAELDRIAEEFRTVPDYLLEWGKDTDAYLEAAGLNAAAHRRWRYGTMDYPTSELPRVLATRDLTH